jgi:hypothetical protein
MSDMIICPYCDMENYDSEYYEGRYDSRQNITCKNCHKIFQYDYVMEPTFSSYIAECLNTGKHQWELKYTYICQDGSGSWGRETCKLCQECRKVDFIPIPNWIFEVSK